MVSYFVHHRVGFAVLGLRCVVHRREGDSPIHDVGRGLSVVGCGVDCVRREVLPENQEDESMKSQNKTVMFLAFGSVVWLLPQSVFACATCFGDPNSSLTHGMNMAIATLLGVTGAVLGGFLAMIIYLARRARRFPTDGGGKISQ
jgi:hypothetical protein